MNLPPRAECDADPTAISIEQARERITNALPIATTVELVECDGAYGRVSAEAIYSPISVNKWLLR